MDMDMVGGNEPLRMNHDRPPTPGPGVSSFEVPLAGDGPLARRAAPSDGPTDPRPNWRRTVGLASLGGVGVGILTSVVLLGLVWDGGDDSDGIGGDPSSNVDDSGRGPSLTTPPTLTPLEPIPVPDGTPTARSSAGLPGRERSLVEQVTVPAYPSVIAGAAPSPGEFDLYAAVAQLGADVDRRSSTRLELGVGGYRLDVTAARDATNDRYALTIDAGDRPARWIITDAGTQMYLDSSSPDEEQWLPLAGEDFAQFYGFDELPTLLDRLMQGPVRSDTISSAKVTPRDFVLLDDGDSVARQFTIEIPGALIPEWQLYVLGPTDEFLPSDRPNDLTYTVYVDRRNEIVRVTGLSDLGGIPQLVVHDAEAPTEPVEIDLPDPASINVDPQGLMG